MFGKLSLGTGHLAASAKTATAANRVHVDPEAARRFQDRRVQRKTAATPRRRVASTEADREAEAPEKAEPSEEAAA